eukprot:gene16538-21120_t
MKPGAMLLISTPSDQGGSNADEHGESFIGEHVRDGYPVEEMRQKLKTAGFDKSEILYSYGAPAYILNWIDTYTTHKTGT